MSIDTPTAARPWTREWFCEGTPAPGGSKTVIHFWKKDGRLVTKWVGGREMPVFNVTDSGGEKNKVWKQTVAWQARVSWKLPPTDRPCEFQMIFFLRRPKCHWGTGRNAGHLLPSAPAFHTQAPDLTKFIRAAEDGLKGVVWLDDSQVFRQPGCEKRWAGAQDKTGAIIRVRIL